MPRFHPGQSVRALYLDPDQGTILGPGVVTGVQLRPDGGQRVFVSLVSPGNVAKVQEYITVGIEGATDYLVSAEG